VLGEKLRGRLSLMGSGSTYPFGSPGLEMSRTIDKFRLRQALRKLRQIPFNRDDPADAATAPQEMLDFLAMLAGLKPVVLLGRGFDDHRWIAGVSAIARKMSLHLVTGPKWEAEP
jgi:hypothetical protein